MKNAVIGNIWNTPMQHVSEDGPNNGQKVPFMTVSMKINMKPSTSAFQQTCAAWQVNKSTKATSNLLKLTGFFSLLACYCIFLTVCFVLAPLQSYSWFHHNFKFYEV